MFCSNDTCFVIAIYVLEPIWRMKALTAISIAAVSMVKNAAFAYLALFGAIAVIHILQFAVLAGVWYFFGGFSRFGDAFYFLVLCGIPSDTIVGFCFTYLFYSLIKQLALSVAYKRMFAPDA